MPRPTFLSIVNSKDNITEFFSKFQHFILKILKNHVPIEQNNLRLQHQVQHHPREEKSPGRSVSFLSEKNDLGDGEEHLSI